MTKVRIKRTNTWMNRARRVDVCIDGEKIGTLSNNETKDFTIAPGQHQLKAKINWCGSKDYSFDMRENKVEAFKIDSFKNSKHLLIVGCNALAIFLLLKFALQINNDILNGFGFGIALGGVLVLVYYLTLGRNAYLEIKRTI